MKEEDSNFCLSDKGMVASLLAAKVREKAVTAFLLWSVGIKSHIPVFLSSNTPGVSQSRDPPFQLSGELTSGHLLGWRGSLLIS